MSAKGLKKSTYKSPPSVTGNSGDNNTSIQSDRKKQTDTIVTKRRGGKSK